MSEEELNRNDYVKGYAGEAGSRLSRESGGEGNGEEKPLSLWEMSPQTLKRGNRT